MYHLPRWPSIGCLIQKWYIFLTRPTVADYSGTVKRPFIIYKRGAGKKKPTFYAGFLDPVTGTYVRRALKDAQGRPVTAVGLAQSRALEIFQEGVQARGGASLLDFLTAFWAEGGQYDRDRRDQGKPLSRAYLANSRGQIRAHVKPFLGGKPVGLEQVTPALLRDLMRSVRDKGLSPRTVNMVYQAVAVPLADYWRGRGRPERNPAASVKRFAEAPAKREILGLDEVRALFAAPWPDARHAAINLLAATTGLRLGECLGLQHEDLREGYLHVCHNWQDGEGLKLPKWRHVRDVPLPARTEAALRELVKANRFGGPFIFWGTTAAKPIPKRMVENVLRDQLAAIKITDAERRRRGLTFHSWRHWYNSMLRGHVPDHSLRALTGHRSEGMTERYTEITGEQREAVKKLAEGML